MLSCICLLLPLPGNAAESPADTFRFEIPAIPLEEALRRFSLQTGISLGMSGKLPAVTAHAVRGRYSARDALDQLLAGSGLEAQPIDPTMYRLQMHVEAKASDSAESLRQLPREAAAELAEITVTGTKRAQNLGNVPASVTIVHGTGLVRPGMAGGSRAMLLQDASMSSTNLGPGRNRQYIRGVADTPFLGPSQATVSVQFDDARATYDGPDPDLLLIDVEQVEILKGPQGPLYGTGALGGVFHIVPHRADLSRFSLQGGAHLTSIAEGNLAGGASVMLNAPLVPGNAGMRVVAYASAGPGWIDNSDGRNNANRTQVRGGRLALRSVLPGDWLVDLQAVTQLANTRDSQYVNDDSRTLRRAGILPEPQDNDFRLLSVTASGWLFGQHALVTGSVISHEADGMLDASQSAAAWQIDAPVRYFDDRQYQLVNQELRLWGESAGLQWLVGASHLSAHSDLNGTLLPMNGSNARSILQQAHHAQETALFAELGLPMAARFRGTAALRLMRSDVESEGAATGTEFESETTYATPSISIDWHSSDELRFIYLRYARAVRPGGVDPAGSQGTTRFAADELSNVDLGLRLRPSGMPVALQGALFATRWSHIQSDYLRPGGLIGTHNVGGGRNIGIEGSAQWHAGAWRFEAGATLQHARLHMPSDSGPDDLRLPVVPDLRLRGSMERTFRLREWQGQARAEVTHTGSARLSFDEALDRRMPGYATIDASLGLRRERIGFTLHISNLMDSRADTFAFGNPFSVQAGMQRTPLQPRSITLGMTFDW